MRPLLILALAVWVAPVAGAQSSYHLSFAPGTRVRVTTVTRPGTKVTGDVSHVRADTLVLVTRSWTETFPLSQLRTLEVRSGYNRKKGMLIGAIIGAALGATSSDQRASTAAGMAMIGSVFGFAFAPRGWERLPLPETSR